MIDTAPMVSVIMPAYNRADTIARAVGSVIAQTYTDWELIVVDDGSTDDTASHIPADRRIRVIRQNNQGITGARNTGLTASRGALIGFLDSDDEWFPHHLELCVAFLQAHPAEQFVTTEVLEDFGGGRTLIHFHIEIAHWYPEEARLIRSRALDPPPGEADQHLRVYQTSEPVGHWGASIVQRAGRPPARLYTGRVFRHLRWGYLMGMQATVLTREAFDAVGLFDTRYRNVSDFGFMAALCRAFRANYIATPTCIKHEFATAGRAIAQDHLATGQGAVQAAQDMLSWFETLFWSAHPADRELSALRAMRHLILAKRCFERGRRAEALAYARQSWGQHPRFWEPRLVWCYVKMMPDAALSRRLWHQAGRATTAVRNLAHGRLTARGFVAKAARALRGAPPTA